MGESYKELLAESQALAARVEAARKAEKTHEIEKMKEAIRLYDITATDLGLNIDEPPASPEAKNKAIKAERSKIKSVQSKNGGIPKYIGPNGEKYFKGVYPGWLKDAKADGTIETYLNPAWKAIDSKKA